ncbi:MAG: cytochrome c [Gammaproteobacteria bacterium]|nr:cytochrome c [Gammaproteobacteria bacterium]MCZ6855416.1 cytochrome c [Gammaproteobacteria bacterium]
MTLITGALLLVAVSAMPLLGATQSISVWAGIYTDAQAARGKEVFIRACAECHATQPGEMAGDGTAPSLIGENFSYRWTDYSIVGLFDTIRQTMPEAAPNSLSPAEYADVTAYLLEINGYPVGTAELDYTQRERLGRTFIDEKPPED